MMMMMMMKPAHWHAMVCSSAAASLENNWTQLLS
jgi:hypothetical protein